MRSSFRVGTIHGIPIGINYSWIIIFLLITWSLAQFFFPAEFPGWSTGLYWLVGAVTSLLFFASVLGHELAHSFVAQSKGIAVESITLFVFGGVSNITKEADTPGDEFVISVIGPVSSFVFGGIFIGLAFLFRGVSIPIAAAAGYLGFINILLGLFNLIPGFPLDGGRVLRSIIWKSTNDQRRATRIAAHVGQAVAFAFILVGIILIFLGAFLSGIWLIFIGWFLHSAASSSSRQVGIEDAMRGVRVSQIMVRDYQSVPANMTLRELVDTYVLGQGVRSLPVVSDSNLEGLITLKEIKDVDPNDWPIVRVSEVMTPLSELSTVRPTDDLLQVVHSMEEKDINQLPVTEGNHLVGLITRSGIIRFLKIRQELGP